jgi:hypothetical protein
LAGAFSFVKSLRNRCDSAQAQRYTFTTKIRRNDGIKRVEDK